MSEETKYLSCAETAKLIRAQLKKEFPGQKFSVRSHVYAGGASINVDWTDRVGEKAVTKLVKKFEGKGFDGMIDMAYNKSIWLLPNGDAEYGESPGTFGSGGVRNAYNIEKPHPDAVLISPGADYIFANKEISAELQEKTARAVAKIEGIEFIDMMQIPGIGNVADNWYSIVNQLLYDVDTTNFKGIKKTDVESGRWYDFYEVEVEK